MRLVLGGAGGPTINTRAHIACCSKQRNMMGVTAWQMTYLLTYIGNVPNPNDATSSSTAAAAVAVVVAVATVASGAGVAAMTSVAVVVVAATAAVVVADAGFTSTCAAAGATRMIDNRYDDGV